jgi:hypothetical protein
MKKPGDPPESVRIGLANHEIVKTAEFLDHVRTRAKVKMIGV